MSDYSCCIVGTFAAESVVDQLGEGKSVGACDVSRVLVGELYAIDVGDIEEGWDG